MTENPIDSVDLRSLSIDDYDYNLDNSRIALHPLEKRDECLLLVRNHDGTLADHRFTDIPSLLPAGALLIANDTRVINARLHFSKPATPQGPGALIEILALEPVSPADYALNFASTGPVEWKCFVGNSKKWKSGPLTMAVTLDGAPLTLTATRTGRDGNASVVRFDWDSDASFSSVIEAAGVIPIPPYLNRDTEPVDSVDYQTVFSRLDGSVAAPTAGLHFTPPLLEQVAARGIDIDHVTLHVGAGTFKPVTSETIGGHEMHSEWIAVGRDTIRRLARRDRPVVAVGTTSVRTLESLYHLGCLALQGRPADALDQWYAYSPDHPQPSVADALGALLVRMDADGTDTLTAHTGIIIGPGYRFRIVDAMITNFHQPRSTLLLLVSAFTGGDWRRLYDHATADPRYRFLSYGDACLLL